MKIGMIGLGRMGASMAARLIERGHEVAGWNRTRARAEAIEGLSVKDTPAAVVAGADAVIVMVLDEAASRQVYQGDGGLLSADLGGALVIDMSTLAPSEMAKRAEQATGAGAAFVACPVGGTVGPARNGQLLGLAGGQAAAIERARPVLDELCKAVEVFDTPAAAAAMKLAVNLPLLAAFQALGEAALITRGHDIPPQRFLDIIKQSPGSAPAIGMRADGILAEMEGKAPKVLGFSLDAVEKDLRLMDEVGQREGFALPVVEAVRKMAHAASNEGWGDRDLAALTAFNLRA